MRKAKNRDRSERYVCVGENWKDNAPIGDCGETKTLMQWLIHLSHKDEEYLNQFFDETYTNNNIADYIYRSWGKRLEKAKYEVSK